MKTGHRVFAIAADNNIELISQKDFNGFCLRSKPTLKRFAGREIHVAVVFYTVADRRPSQVFRIDSQRFTVTADGAIDRDRCLDVLRLAMNRIDSGFAPRIQATPSGVVVDATACFDEKRWAQYHPELPSPALKHIVKALFPGHALRAVRVSLASQWDIHSSSQKQSLCTITASLSVYARFSEGMASQCSGFQSTCCSAGTSA